MCANFDKNLAQNPILISSLFKTGIFSRSSGESSRWRPGGTSRRLPGKETCRDFSGAFHAPAPAALQLPPGWKRSGQRCLIWAGTQCPDHCRKGTVLLHEWSASARRNPTRAAPQFPLSEAPWPAPDKTSAGHHAVRRMSSRTDTKT